MVGTMVVELAPQVVMGLGLPQEPLVAVVEAPATPHGLMCSIHKCLGGTLRRQVSQPKCTEAPLEHDLDSCVAMSCCKPSFSLPCSAPLVLDTASQNPVFTSSRPQSAH